MDKWYLKGCIDIIKQIEVNTKIKGKLWKNLIIMILKKETKNFLTVIVRLKYLKITRKKKDVVISNNIILLKSVSNNIMVEDEDIIQNSGFYKLYCNDYLFIYLYIIAEKKS